MTCTTDDIKNLFAEFPPDAIRWRAQSVTKDGTKAMALAYVDARDVMDRLDSVCGTENWQDSYEETPSGRVICTIAIKIDGEWITKSDGAGSSAMEGEKGGISDAFKRAGVKWGIARYLYDLPAPWVPCESGEWNGKKQFKRFTEDPWNYVRGKGPAKPSSQLKKEDAWPVFIADLDRAETMDDVTSLKIKWRKKVQEDNWPAAWIKAMPDEFEKVEASIREADAKHKEPEFAP